MTKSFTIILGGDTDLGGPYLNKLGDPEFLGSFKQ